MTTRLGVVGSPISHSLSPLLHNSAYRYLGLDFDYQKYEVSNGLRGFFSEDFLGLSVTMPLKDEAFDLADFHDEVALQTKTVNTLLRRQEGIYGFNTDCFGIRKSLAEVRADSITVLGSGATARSAVYALAELFPAASLKIVARNPQARQELVEFANALGLAAVSAELEHSTVIDSDLVVSTVPANTADVFWQGLSEKPTGWLLDVAYDPWPSLAAASWAIEERVISGLTMLKWQASEQVRLFSGADYSFDHQLIFNVMTEALSQNSG